MEMVPSPGECEPCDRPGSVLGSRYELVCELGSGGMAVVWEAIAHGSDGFAKRVAVKRLLRQYRGFPEIVEMFVEEARLGAILRHPNIVEVFDFGLDEHEHHYLVSELVRGLDLRQLVRSHAPFGAPWPVVAAIAVEVLRALEAAHSRQDDQGRPAPVLHRDVSPSNILIDERGVVKLADFGLARATDRGRRTRPDVVKGKLSYLAPEVLWGEEPSVASDLFSLGVVLWEALTGQKLFEAESDIALVKRVREAKVPLLTTRRPDLPLGLVSVVHRALEREPEQRFAGARPMLEAIVYELRLWPETTDSSLLARSVAEARRRLAGS